MVQLRNLAAAKAKIVKQTERLLSLHRIILLQNIYWRIYLCHVTQAPNGNFLVV
ncbi:hypothetical protein LFUMFP_220069 [Latilactobacillus fuchuensis]|uniref:Uncharacterized protein n=1 Tax=Latilactobacillus fuchuensis TaxID=164393 RepID=A0A2N9DV28_9LACO|nr:hypothetical protein LFUMFP_220069 [Latilactobacillus fuchuensis]